MTYKNDFKQQARILENFLTEKKIPITHSLALETIAKINGYKDWNTMSAISTDAPQKSNMDSYFNLSNFHHEDHDKQCLNIYMLNAIKHHNIEELLRVGADIECLDDLCDLMRFDLEQGQDSWRRIHPGSTPLILASKLNLPEVVKILLRYKANTMAKDMAGMTALDWAYKENHHTVSKILIDYNSKV